MPTGGKQSFFGLLARQMDLRKVALNTTKSKPMLFTLQIFLQQAQRILFMEVHWLTYPVRGYDMIWQCR